MINIPIANRIAIRSVPTGIELLLESSSDTFSFMLTPEQLNVLYVGIANTLDPDRQYLEHIKRLKEFKRQVFTHYKKEQDPEIKQQKLTLYIETKKLVEDLEKRL